MKSPSLKQESISPKREQTHEAEQTASRIALGKRRLSQAPNMAETPTRRVARAFLRQMAESPNNATSQRLASTPSLAIAERLPVRTTKVVPSIELAESSLSSSSGSESGSDSEYNDEQWRRHLARRDPVRKAPTKRLVLQPNTTPSVVESTRTAAPKPGKTLLTLKPTAAVQTPTTTVTVKAPKPTATVPVVGATVTLPASSSTTAAQTLKAMMEQRAPQPARTQLAPTSQPRKRPIKLKEDPDAWVALRAQKKKLSKMDVKELEDYERRQRCGTANPFRATEEQVLKAFGMCPRKHTRSSREISEPLSTGQTHLLSHPEEPVMGQGSLSLSIERDQTPNLVDRLAEGLPQVIDLEDPTPEPPSPVKSEICEVVAMGASTAENEIPDASRVETVSKEVADLRCEVQYFKGQVWAYERTLEVDGVQIQHRLAFDAAVEKKKDPKDPKIREESANEASVSVPSKQKRPKLDKRTGAERTAIPRREPGPSPQTEETEGRDPPSRDHGSSVTDRDSRKRARTFTEPAPSTLGRDDRVDESTKDMSSKRPKKGKISKKENERHLQGKIIAFPKASEPKPGEPTQAAPDQPRAFERDQDNPIQSRPGIGPHQMVAPRRSLTNITTQPIGVSPTLSRSVDPIVIKHDPTSTGTSTDVAQKRARPRAQQAPVASISAPHTNEVPRSGPSVWKVGVNSIPLGPRQPRREPPHRGQTIQDRRNQRWQQSYDRREVVLPNALPRCVCRVLHSYFESGLNRRPNLAAFPGTREQFFANVEQIVSCRGHDKEMIIFCEGLWASEQANRKVSSRSKIEGSTAKALNFCRRCFAAVDFPLGTMFTCDSRTTVLSLRPTTLPPRELSRSRQDTVRLSKRNTWVDNGRFDADAQALSCRICFTAQRRQLPTGLGNVNGHEGNLLCRSKSRKEIGSKSRSSEQAVVSRSYSTDEHTRISGKKLDGQ